MWNGSRPTKPPKSSSRTLVKNSNRHFSIKQIKQTLGRGGQKDPKANAKAAADAADSADLYAPDMTPGFRMKIHCPSTTESLMIRQKAIPTAVFNKFEQIALPFVQILASQTTKLLSVPNASVQHAHAHFSDVMQRILESCTERVDYQDDDEALNTSLLKICTQAHENVIRWTSLCRAYKKGDKISDLNEALGPATARPTFVKISSDTSALTKISPTETPSAESYQRLHAAHCSAVLDLTRNSLKKNDWDKKHQQKVNKDNNKNPKNAKTKKVPPVRPPSLRLTKIATVDNSLRDEIVNGCSEVHASLPKPANKNNNKPAKNALAYDQISIARGQKLIAAKWNGTMSAVLHHRIRTGKRIDSTQAAAWCVAKCSQNHSKAKSLNGDHHIPFELLSLFSSTAQAHGGFVDQTQLGRNQTVEGENKKAIQAFKLMVEAMEAILDGKQAVLMNGRTIETSVTVSPVSEEAFMWGCSRLVQIQGRAKGRGGSAGLWASLAQNALNGIRVTGF